MHRTSLLLVGAVVGLALPLAASAATPAGSGTQWVATDLGTLGSPFSNASAINQRGQVVGTSRTADGVPHVFMWQNGKMTDLGRYGWDKDGPSIMINDRGQVVWNEKGRGAVMWEAGRLTRLTGRPVAMNNRGQVVVEVGNRSAFVWQNGTTTALPTLPSPESFEYQAINDRGQIAGTRLTREKAKGPLSSQAFLWQSGKMRLLGVLPGFDESTAVAIEDNGDVLGFCDTETPFRLHPFLWHDGKMTDLDPNGPDWVYPVALNDRGEVIVRMSVKSSLPPLNWLHQFFWADGRMHDLGVTGYSDSYLNGRGQIATTMLTPKHRWFAFVWENGIASDLSGGRWSYADGINDRGQIVGSRSTGGSSHGYRVFHAVLWTHTPG